MEIARIGVHWDGATLMVRPSYYPGWRALVGIEPNRPRSVRLPVSNIHDITPFELGVVITGGTSQLTDNWHEARVLAGVPLSQEALFGSQETALREPKTL